MNQRLFVGLDVGGTTMKAGVVDDNGRLLHHVSLPTEARRGQEIGLATMAECICNAIKVANLSIDQIMAIGVATPGSSDLRAGIMIDPPNLRPWHNVPVRLFIADAFQKPTAFENDANAAAFGESWVGAGKDCDSMVLFTLGTGIGGGIVLNGRIWDGAHSHGGELGHTRIDSTSGRLCTCGRRGCLEAYASATSVVARTREALLDDGGKSALHSISELTSKVIFEAAAAGDELAMLIVDRTAYYLAVGAANAIHTVDPDLICFGGGMIAAGESFLELIKNHVREIAFAFAAERVAIRYAALGNNAGMLGAAGCARSMVGRADSIE